MENLELVKSLQQKSFSLVLHVLKGGGRCDQVRVPECRCLVGGLVDGGLDLPDDAPDEEAVVADRPPLRHLRHPQIEVHPVAAPENINQWFSRTRIVKTFFKLKLRKIQISCYD